MHTNPNLDKFDSKAFCQLISATRTSQYKSLIFSTFSLTFPLVILIQCMTPLLPLINTHRSTHIQLCFPQFSAKSLVVVISQTRGRPERGEEPSSPKLQDPPSLPYHHQETHYLVVFNHFQTLIDTLHRECYSRYSKQIPGNAWNDHINS